MSRISNFADRMNAMKQLLTILLAIAPMGIASAADRPNIVWIFSEDQSDPIPTRPKKDKTSPFTKERKEESKKQLVQHSPHLHEHQVP